MRESRRCGHVDRASQENNFLVGSAGELKSIGRLQRAGCSPRRDCLSAEYGQSDVEAGKAFADDTIVRAFSMTKPITTVAAMMLYEEGAFQLDDPIARYLPEFLNTPVWAGGNAPLEDTSPQETPITVRQIMTHTSGLTYGFMQTNVVDAAYRKAGIGGPSDIKNLQAWVKKAAEIPWYLSQAHNGTIVFRRMC